MDYKFLEKKENVFFNPSFLGVYTVFSETYKLYICFSQTI